MMHGNFSTNYSTFLQVAEARLLQDVATVYTVGIGSGVDSYELEQIASGNYYYTVGGVADLRNLQNQFGSAICSGGKYTDKIVRKMF